MSSKILKVFGLATSLLMLAGCPSAQTQDADPGPPPPQNLLGSTDELQLVTELSRDLASKYGGDRVLVVLEIDNTLLFAEQDSECPTREMRLAQEDGARQVRRMQDAGLKVIALTSRGPDCRQQTLGELQRNGFSFQASAWPPQAGYPEAFTPAGASHPVQYKEGVFFAAGQNKGLMLKALLAKAGEPYPALFVMVDDRQDSLNEVMKEFSWTKTKVHAWRYTREDTVAVAADN